MSDFEPKKRKYFGEFLKYTRQYVCKLKNTASNLNRKPNFSDQFKKIIKRYIKVGYNLDVMRQSACLVLNPITVNSCGFLFNCTTVGQALDSMTALTVCWCLMLICSWAHRGST